MATLTDLERQELESIIATDEQGSPLSSADELLELIEAIDGFRNWAIMRKILAITGGKLDFNLLAKYAGKNKCEGVCKHFNTKKSKPVATKLDGFKSTDAEKRPIIFKHEVMIKYVSEYYELAYLSYEFDSDYPEFIRKENLDITFEIPDVKDDEEIFYVDGKSVKHPYVTIYYVGEWEDNVLTIKRAIGMGIDQSYRNKFDTDHPIFDAIDTINGFWDEVRRISLEALA